MIKIILIVSVIYSYAFSSNLLYEKDKQLHYASSFAIAYYASSCLYKDDKFKSFLFGIGASVIIGWAKEYVDGKGYGTKDIEDIDADMFGALSGAFCYTYIYKF